MSEGGITPRGAQIRGGSHFDTRGGVIAKGETVSEIIF